MPAKNEVVPSRFDWGIVAASCIASLCGCYLAVELLHRRGTGVRSKRSWAETITCAVCLGLIGIWCMHFIGNRAIILGDGSDDLQLVYNPGFSVLSAVLPIAILVIAFALQELQYRSRKHRSIALVVTGICSGLSVVGMHYVGNLGISNYHLHYPPDFFAASFIVAIADCLTVMGLFYTWRERWISRWPRRLICAALLAIGISSMHFIASTNCVYRFKHYSEPNAVRSRNIQVIVAGILCAAAAIAVGVFLLMSRLRDRLRKKRSKKVMLNCAMFHPDGRLLVTTEGMLPAREITNKYHHRTFSEEFDTNHPVFHWIFRVSRNWTSVSDFIQTMKSHINALRADGSDDSRPNSPAPSTRFESDTYLDYSFIFRERFCVAAANLAASMNLPLTLIGVLFDRIIDTGTLGSEDETGNGDVEMAGRPDVYGTGQLLFLTRQLGHEDTDRLINAGFKFATINQVGRNIANTLQIPLSILEGYVADLRRYIDVDSAPKKSGTWLSCFAMISKLDGFDIAVKKAYQDQLPDIQILPQNPVEWQETFLNVMHKQSFAACVGFLQTVRDSTVGHTNSEQNFAGVLLRAFAALAAQVPLSWLNKAVFFGKQLQAHFSEPLGASAPITHLYAFVAITEIHASFEGFTDIITPVPLPFLKVRQQCRPGSRNHAVLSQDAHQEFAALLARKTVKNEDKCKKLCISFPKRNNEASKAASRQVTAIRSSGENHNENSLEMSELVDPMEMILQSSRALQAITHTIEEREAARDRIMVNNETVVRSDNRSGSSMEIRPVVNNRLIDRSNVFDGGSGTSTAAVTVALPEETFVDELIGFATLTFSRSANRI